MCFFGLAPVARRQVLHVSLPVSGTGDYAFDEAAGRWVSAGSDHRHDLEGIIVRDLLRQCRGCPGF